MVGVCGMASYARRMVELSTEDTKPRTLGLALLDASRVYEDFPIPRHEGGLHQRRFPHHRCFMIGLIARRRRFLRATYALADADLMLEAIGPLRSMFEFLVTARWLDRDPNRNWKLWLEQ